VWSKSTNVTDGQTDGQTTYRQYSARSAQHSMTR